MLPVPSVAACSTARRLGATYCARSETFERVAPPGSADRAQSSPCLRWDRSRADQGARSHQACACLVCPLCDHQSFVPVRYLLPSTIETFYSRNRDVANICNGNLDARFCTESLHPPLWLFGRIGDVSAITWIGPNCCRYRWNCVSGPATSQICSGDSAAVATVVVTRLVYL